MRFRIRIEARRLLDDESGEECLIGLSAAAKLDPRYAIAWKGSEKFRTDRANYQKAVD